MYCRRCYRDLQNEDITVQQAKEKVKQGAMLIDVRSWQEYREGHLNGAINIPEYEIINRIEKEVPQKNQLIIVYCQYGGRSKNAVTMMKRIGYTNVYNLYGGLDMI